MSIRSSGIKSKRTDAKGASSCLSSLATPLVVMVMSSDRPQRQQWFSGILEMKYSNGHYSTRYHAQDLLLYTCAFWQCQLARSCHDILTPSGARFRGESLSLLPSPFTAILHVVNIDLPEISLVCVHSHYWSPHEQANLLLSASLTVTRPCDLPIIF